MDPMGNTCSFSRENYRIWDEHFFFIQKGVWTKYTHHLLQGNQKGAHVIREHVNFHQ